MARNRKNQAAATRFGPALKALVLCLLIGGSGVGYVWQKDQIRQLGDHIKQRENRRSLLVRENDARRHQLETMRSLGVLEARIKELNLGLVQPAPSQILRLQEPSRDCVAAPVEYAAQQQGSARTQ
jgi:hypothetical protein